MMQFDSATDIVFAKRQEVSSARSLLVAITGIDSAGKGYVAERIGTRLRELGLAVAVVNVDGWLRLPAERFDANNPAQHFYEHAIRFDELFADLILPLKAHRSHRLQAELADATDADVYRRHTYEFTNVDVILLDGIFLLKREYRHHFDLSFWIDCSFEAALERALVRGQEGLSREETVNAFQTVYFPAQRLHIAQDDPRSAASAIINNDPRIA